MHGRVVEAGEVPSGCGSTCVDWKFSSSARRTTSIMLFSRVEDVFFGSRCCGGG